MSTPFEKVVGRQNKNCANFLLHPERPSAEMYHITVIMYHFDCSAQQ